MEKQPTIDELIHEFCPDGVEYKELGDLVAYEQPGKYIVVNTDYQFHKNNNVIPVLTAGKSFILGYTSEKNHKYFANELRPVIIFDDFTTSFHWVDFEFSVKSSALKILYSISNDNLRFIYYAMKCINYSTLDHSRQWISNFSHFRIPVPPLSVQKEIVRILDSFTELEAELEAETGSGTGSTEKAV